MQSSLSQALVIPSTAKLFGKHNPHSLGCRSCSYPFHDDSVTKLSGDRVPSLDPDFEWRESVIFRAIQLTRYSHTSENTSWQERA